MAVERQSRPTARASGGPGGSRPSSP